MVRFGQLGAARSRQDESIELGEVGSKRPSLGCNGVHVVWCSGLIFWLLADDDVDEDDDEDGDCERRSNTDGRGGKPGAVT
jgi:hypothetical protein